MQYDEEPPFSQEEARALMPIAPQQGGSSIAKRQPTDLQVQAAGGKAMAAAMTAASIEEVRAAFLVAREFPRDEHQVRARVIAACQSPTLIAKKQGIYSFRIGSSTVEGLTIHVAKEIARSMGNFRFGFYIIHDTPEQRTIRCWAMDLESNTKDEQDDCFAKVVFRKGKSEGDPGFWRTCDERELLMLTNLKASKGIRNCILNLTPFHIRDAALETIYRMIENRIKEDPRQFTRDLLDDFAAVGVTTEEILDYSQVANVDQLLPKQLKYLRGVVNAIKDGATTWKAYVEQIAQKYGITEPVQTAADFASKLAIKAAEAAAKKSDVKGPVATPQKPADPQPSPTDEQKPAATDPPKKARSRSNNPDDLV